MISQELFQEMLKVENGKEFSVIDLPINYYGSKEGIKLYLYNNGENFDISDNGGTFATTGIDKEDFVSIANEWSELFGFELDGNKLVIKNIEKQYVLNAINLMTQVIIILGDYATKGEHRIEPLYE